MVIDERAAAFDQLRRNALTPHQIARDDTAAEPEDRVIGNRHRLVLVSDWNDGGDRTE